MDKMTRGRVAFAVCGSFCTLDAALVQAERLVQGGWQLIPVMSYERRRGGSPDRAGDTGGKEDAQWIK